MLSEKFNPFISKIVYTSLLYVLVFWTNKSDNLSGVYFNLFIYFSFYLAIGVFGYIINDISDEKPDKLAGKTNVTAHLSVIQKLVLSFVLAVIGVAPISFYAPATIPFVIAEILLLVAYAFPPFRLKERGILGVITDSLYAYVIPMLIMLVFLDEFSFISAFYWYFLPLFGFFIGLKNILNHQLEDLDNDQISGVKTFAIEHEKIAHSLEIISAISAVLCWILGLIYLLLNDFPNSIMAVFFVVGCVFLFRTIVYFIYRDEKFLAGMPEFDLIYYGIITLTICAFQEKLYPYLFLSLFIFVPLVRIKIQNILIECWSICRSVYVFIRRILSFIVNYTLYYSCLLVGIDLKERARNRKKPVGIMPSENTSVSMELKEKNVHGLWIGNKLSLMEMLTIKSFISHGYVFHIWIYEPLKNELPDACIVKDANEIIPFEKIFKYNYSSQFGTGKGSYAGFSDIFRYKLLYEKGGWWVDMDVTCLKPFDVDAPYFFRAHHDLPLVGNIMKAPQGSALMLQCYEEAKQEVNENNRDWHKPIAILVKNVFEFELQKHIVSDVSNTDEWHKIKPFVYSNKVAVPENWFFVHWCNEVWRTNGFDKNAPLYASFYGQTLMKYKLIPTLPSEHWNKTDRKMKVKLFVERMLDFI